MEKETNNLIDRVIAAFAKTTGMKVTYEGTIPDGAKHAGDGLLCIAHQDLKWDFAVQVKKNITRATIALEKVQSAAPLEDRIIFVSYVTPPMADLMKRVGLFFMDTAGNGYIKRPPLYLFIKGNKPPAKITGAPVRRLFKTAGLKVLFALLNKEEMANWPYRRIAAMTDVALGTVEWIFRDLKEMGFLVEFGKRNRKLTNRKPLLKRWVEAYPDQLRPKLVLERFQADRPEWWKTVNPMDYDICWGGEIAAAKLTKQLKPGKVVIYTSALPGKLIIQNKLRKNDDGDIEMLKPFWKFDHTLMDQGIVPPLIVYADLIATGDDRNIETAGIIYDKFLI